MRFPHPNPYFKSIPILNQGREVANTSSIPSKGKSPVIITDFQDGTRETYHPENNKIIAVYTDGRKVVDCANGVVITTTGPNNLAKVEYPMKRLKSGKFTISTVYKKFKENMDQGIEETFFVVDNYLNGHLSIVDERKNKVTHFYNKNGRVSVYKNKKPVKRNFLAANISRQALPDGTQIKELKKKGIRIIKRLGPQTKTAEYIKQGQEAVPFLKKNFRTNKWEVLAGVSDAIKGKLLNNIESLSLKDQKFSKVAEEILEFLKNLKVPG